MITFHARSLSDIAAYFDRLADDAEVVSKHTRALSTKNATRVEASIWRRAAEVLRETVMES